MIESTVAALDEIILADPALGPDLFARLLASQRELGLLHGERPTCPFLRPHIVNRSQYDLISQAAETIAFAFEKLALQALINDDLLATLGLTDAEAKMARIDPGYERLCVTSRLDAFLTDSGFQFLEYNAESPAGVGDQMQLEKVLFPLPHMRKFLETQNHWRPEPHRRLLEALLAAYRDWGGEESHPQIAIVDWEGVATASEFRVLRNYFESEKYATVIVDPNELRYDGDRLFAGNFRVDIVYKRVVIHEFLDRCDETHPLVRAYGDGRVCLANSFRTKLAHKKTGFAVLSDPRYNHFFNAEELEVARRHIPWTRPVVQGTTIFEGTECNLLDLINAERKRFVLKPNDDYGGQGVFLGWETGAAEWSKAIQLAQERPYVVQERAPAKAISIPMFSDHVELAKLFVDFNPFLFNNRAEGALVRLSSSSLLNVTSGGGETALLVLQDI